MSVSAVAVVDTSKTTHSTLTDMNAGHSTNTRDSVIPAQSCAVLYVYFDRSVSALYD
jgi:hypothetical protein